MSAAAERWIEIGGFRARVAGADESVQVALARALACAHEERIAGEWIELADTHAQSTASAGMRAYFKGTPFPPKARARHALRSRLLGRPIPRLAEYRNLMWLREHGFAAPEPLAAGALWKGPSPRYQFLATREAVGARRLAAALATIPPNMRLALIEQLARDLGRLHALGFVHRDLYPRNLLVQELAGAPRIVFLDCWRGGARPQLRGPDWDLACLMLEGAGLLALDEQRALFRVYFDERARRGRPASPARFLRAVAHGRAALLARLRREPRSDLFPVAAEFQAGELEP